jgi:BASS family bile acid:Na+ symporter
MSIVRAVVVFLVQAGIFALLLGAGLRSKLRDLAQPSAVLLRALLVIEVAVPLVAMLAVALFRVSEVGAALLLIAAACPGAPFIVRRTEKGEGRASLALTLLVITSLAAPLAVPVWVSLMGRFYGFGASIAPLAVAKVVLPSVIVPLALGMLGRRLAPRLADRVAPWLDGIFKVALVLVVPLLLVLGGRVLIHTRPGTFAAALVIVLASTALGAAAGGSAVEDRVAVSVAAVNGNPALAMLVFTGVFPDLRAAALMSAYIVLRAVVSWLYVRLFTRRRRPAPAPHAARGTA